MTQTRILLAEQDDQLRTFLADNLSADNFYVFPCRTSGMAIQALDSEPWDLMIADVNGHTLDVVDHAAGLVPTIVLSSTPSDQDAVRKLQRGADDYVRKPFSYPELLARIGALQRRTRDAVARRKPVYEVGGLVFDKHAHTCTVDGEPITTLTPAEWRLLAALVADPDRVWPKAELLREVCGYGGEQGTRTIDSHACRLRDKLGGRFVVNIWGIGYRLGNGVIA